MPSNDITYLRYIPFEYIGSSLYSKKEYINNLDTKTFSYSALDQKENIILLYIHFQIIDNQAISLKHAPFGGINFVREVDLEIVKKFIEFVISDLKDKRIDKITIRNPAAFYSSKMINRYEQLLNELHFEVESIDINHHLAVDKPQLIHAMHTMEKRKFQKCTKANFLFKKEKNSKLESIYEFISTCRKERNQSLSMTFHEVQRSFNASPNSYLLFSVYDQSTIIAASICVAVNPSIVYNFYPASRASYNSFSPMVFLLSNIYDFCKKTNYKILDLGTSMVGVKPNHNLIRFKKNIGATQSEKHTYELDLRI